MPKMCLTYDLDMNEMSLRCHWVVTKIRLSCDWDDTERFNILAKLELLRKLVSEKVTTREAVASKTKLEAQ